MPAQAEGQLLPLPVPLSAYEGRRRLVQWDITSELGTGQLLLLARTAHCLNSIAGSAARRQVHQDEAELQARAEPLNKSLLHCQ